MHIIEDLRHKIVPEIRFFLGASLIWVLVTASLLMLGTTGVKYDILNALIWAFGGGVLVNFWFLLLFSVSYLACDFIEQKALRSISFVSIVLSLLCFGLSPLERLAVVVVDFPFGIHLEAAMLVVSAIYCVRRILN